MNATGNNPYFFDGKVALVTGGTSGVGKAIVAALSKAGALVSYCGRREEIGEEQAKELRQAGARVEFVKADVTSEADVKRFVTQAVERHGRVDILVNNAGLEAEPHSIPEIDPADFQRVMDVNVTGTFLMLKFALPALKAAGGGHVVNIGSVLGEVAMPKLAPYVAAKHAVIGLTKSAALEQAPHNILVNAVCPGAVNTDMLWRTIHDSEEAFEHLKTQHPLGRVAEADDVAGAVMWLCSESSAFVTGQVINVDGGFTAQ